MRALIPIMFFLSVFFGIIGAATAKFRSVWFRYKFKKIADRYRGWLITPWFSRPRICFVYGGSEARVSFKRNRFRYEGSQSQFTTAWENRQTCLELRSHGSLVPTKGYKNLHEYSTGDQEFDQQFRVWTNNNEEAKVLLSSAVQWQMDQLRHNAQFQNVAVSIRRGRIIVSSAGLFRKPERLDDFIRLSLELFDQLQLSQTEGIEFVNHLEAAVIQEMVCPVCSSEIADDLVVCIRCKTPHCKDCWQYNGQCATFSCGETRFAIPVAGRPTATNP